MPSSVPVAKADNCELIIKKRKSIRFIKLKVKCEGIQIFVLVYRTG